MSNGLELVLFSLPWEVETSYLPCWQALNSNSKVYCIFEFDFFCSGNNHPEFRRNCYFRFQASPEDDTRHNVPKHDNPCNNRRKNLKSVTIKTVCTTSSFNSKKVQCFWVGIVVSCSGESRAKKPSTCLSNSRGLSQENILSSTDTAEASSLVKN